MICNPIAKVARLEHKQSIPKVRCVTLFFLYVSCDCPCGWQDSRALGPMASCRLVSKMLLETREDIKYSPRALILLIGLQLVDMRQLDEFLAKAVENGRNLVALSCSIKLVNAIVSAEKRETPITDVSW